MLIALEENIKSNFCFNTQALGMRDAQGNNEKLSIATTEDANRAIGSIDAALHQVNKQRADLGAYQNRAEMAKKGIDIAAENMQSAESLVRDTNMAEEMVKYTRDLILGQAATALLGQANSKQDLVLSLLK
jgi:flagellin